MKRQGGNAATVSCRRAMRAVCAATALALAAPSTLAQTPSEMLLDEPTNHLDIQHQIELLRLVSTLRLTSIIALHDLNHAAMFCDSLIILQQGRIVASGTPEEIITQELLRDVFSVDARVETSSHHGRPHIHYLR